MSYTLKQDQLIATDLDSAWQFFSKPDNLGKLTPPNVHFKIMHNDCDKMHPGQIICYKIRVAPFINLSWVTEITIVEELKRFVDDQRVGPYALWHHSHHFETVQGGTMMKDVIHYALPYGLFGKIAHALFVKNKLKRIFEYRREVIDQLFNQ